MEILSHKNYQQLLDYLPNIKSSLKEWQLVDIRLTENSDTNFTAAKAAELVHTAFKDKEGKIYLCNEREIFMLIRWGEGIDPLLIAKPIEEHLPKGSCKISVHEPTPEGLQKLEMLISYRKSSESSPFADMRASRRENVILVADDDMYMRTLVKKGAASIATVQEVANGNEIITAYKKHTPDILFLDIHMPGRDGTEVLHDILAIDADAYVIMLSADSSQENVAETTKKGAKGFMTKPFTKEKLLEYVKLCPTLS